jgi:hypothetical protein
MIEDMRIRNLSRATQQFYVLRRHFDYPPARLDIEQVAAYQLHLVAQKRSWAHVNAVAEMYLARRPSASAHEE